MADGTIWPDEAQGELSASFLAMEEGDRLRVVEKVFARMRWKAEPREIDSGLCHLAYYLWVKSPGSKPYFLRYKYAFVIDIDLSRGGVRVVRPQAVNGNPEMIMGQFLRLLEIERSIYGIDKRMNGHYKDNGDNPTLRSPLDELHPDLKERRETVLRLKQQHYTHSEIAKGAQTSTDNVKKDVEWLRKNRLLPKD
ncbi:MAG: hypothetical protein M1570_18580 [Chloroflexi bacterium]|nr:hypothetical protein [Chloroflexota bacterium]